MAIEKPSEPNVLGEIGPNSHGFDHENGHEQPVEVVSLFLYNAGLLLES